MSFQATLDLSRFYEAHDRTMVVLREGLASGAERAAREGAHEAQAVGRFKDRTGELRRNIHAERVTEAARGAVWQMVSPKAYSWFVEKGTRPHEIRGNPRLVFFWEKIGAWVSLEKVNHPGGKPYPFMGPGALKAERVLIREAELLRDRMGDVWKR